MLLSMEDPLNAAVDLEVLTAREHAKAKQKEHRSKSSLRGRTGTLNQKKKARQTNKAWGGKMAR